MTSSRFLPKRFKAVLLGIYLLLVSYCFISYWFISESPILSPVFAKLHSFVGDIKELPIGEKWTKRYTLRISPSNGAGLINKDCVVFLPFPARAGSRQIEIELRSLLVCPGYKSQVTILLNDDPIRVQPIGYNWQRIRMPLLSQRLFLPLFLILRFDMEKISDIPEYQHECIIQVFPDKDGLKVWESGEWKQQNEWKDLGGVRITRKAGILIIDEQKYALENWPFTVALTRWNSVLLRSQLQNVSIAACKVIRII